MKKQQLLSAISVGLISMGLASSVDAALVSRLGGQAYYDTVADLTWLADANYAMTSGYVAANAVTGTMGWQAANVWAAQLTVGGVSGWRLPKTLQPDTSCSFQSGGISSAYNCTGSELGNLFYNVLGGAANASITTTHNTNYNLFSNVQSQYYWSATEYAPSTDRAWTFGMFAGFQGNNIKSSSYYGWALQSGDVSAVPVPTTAWLFGSGLLGLIGVARRKSANI